MGFQQSYCKFESREKLNEELTKYWKRDREGDAADIIGVVVAKKELKSWGIEENEALLVLSGARYVQNVVALEEELGIKADRAGQSLTNFFRPYSLATIQKTPSLSSSYEPHPCQEATISQSLPPVGGRIGLSISRPRPSNPTSRYCIVRRTLSHTRLPHKVRPALQSIRQGRDA